MYCLNIKMFRKQEEVGILQVHDLLHQRSLRPDAQIYAFATGDPIIELCHDRGRRYGGFKDGLPGRQASQSSPRNCSRTDHHDSGLRPVSFQVQLI